MSILIIGGNGLVGTRLTQKLAELGEKVVSTGTHIPAKQVEGVVYEICDVTEYGTLNMIIKNYKVDCIIHNAAISSPKYFSDNPHKVMRVNVMGTLTALEAARNFDISRFVYVSSEAVYGNSIGVDTLYEDSPRRGVDAYSASKIACEEIVRNYQIPTVSLRIGFVYGPGRVIECPIRQMVEEIVTTGSVNWECGMDQMQDYIYIDDAVDGIIAALKSDTLNQAEYNMASGEQVSFERIVKKVQEHFPDAKISIGPGDLGFNPSSKVYMENAFRDFKWRPKYSMEDGLDVYIPWIKEQIKFGK